MLAARAGELDVLRTDRYSPSVRSLECACSRLSPSEFPSRIVPERARPQGPTEPYSRTAQGGPESAVAVSGMP
jgi:hypothetical protein